MKRLLWGVLICGFVLFSLSPTFYELSQKDKLVNRHFELVHNYVTDYNFYLSRIREGMEGRWTVIERYTSESHPGSFIQIFYLLLGKPVSMIPNQMAGAVIAYHTARVLFGLLFLALVARACVRMFKRMLWQVLGFLMIVTSSTLPIVVWLPTGWRFGGYMSWWTVMDSLQRITFLPHLLFGQAAIVFLVCDLFDIPKRMSSFWLFIKFCAAFCLGMVFPPGFMFVGVVYGFECIIEFFSTKRSVWIRDALIPRIAVLSGGIPTILYYSLMLTLAPWRRLVEFDQLNPTWFPLVDYAKALGPLLVFGLIGAVVGMVRKEKKTIPYVSWILAMAFLLFVFQYIPQQSPLRFTEMAPQVPLGMLTVFLFYQCTLFVNQLTKKYNVWKTGIYIILYTVYFTPIVLGLGVMWSSYLWQKDFINQKVQAGWPAISMNNVIVYPIQGFVDALSYIETSVPKEAIILSDLTAGNYIPSYTGRRVFVGHDNTLDKEKKLVEARSFLKNEMSVADAWSFVTQNKIGYVFVGPQEKALGNTALSYPFLQSVYTNNDVTVYAVSPANTQ